MRAVNLLPSDSRRGSRGVATGLPLGPAYAVIAALLVAVVFVTVLVLTNNTISERQAKLTGLQSQLAQEQAQAARLANYVSFEKLAQARAETVREIASTRFDWYSALSDLSRVVPANTSLNFLFGSVAPGATIANGGGSGSGDTGSLRTDVSVPAFELSGCTSSQDDVARLMSRLRLINGVTRVTLADAEKPLSTGAPGVSAATGSAQGCGRDAPAFDLVVFFQSLPGAGPSGALSVAAQTGTTGATGPASGTSTTPASRTSTTPASGTSTTPASGTSTTPATGTSATPVSTSGSAK